MKLPAYGFSEATREAIINNRLRDAQGHLLTAIGYIKQAEAYMYDTDVQTVVAMWTDDLEELAADIDYAVSGGASDD